MTEKGKKYLFKILKTFFEGAIAYVGIRAAAGELDFSSKEAIYSLGAGMFASGISAILNVKDLKEGREF